MKKIFIAICGISFAMTGCKEHDVPLTFTPATDSTYILPSSAIPAADPHNVLVEEFTGQSCSNCPAAHTMLDGLATSGHVNILGLYINNFAQTIPPLGSIYDFRDTIASQIGTGVYGSIPAIPSGGVDRVPVSSNILLYAGSWSAAIASQKALTDSINLQVESNYSGGVATIKATITYLQSMSTPQNLSIAIVEDSMIGLQEDDTAVNNSYVFKDVFRDMVSHNALGDPILDTVATKVAGTVYWRKYTYTPRVVSPAMNPVHCRVVAFVNSPGRGGDYHILQSADAAFMH